MVPVLVLGEHKSQKGNIDGTSLQVVGHVAELYGVQCFRHYVNAFTTVQNQMRLWLFDRCGGQSSTAFNLIKDRRKFIKLVLAYTIMDYAQLGYDQDSLGDAACTTPCANHTPINRDRTWKDQNESSESFYYRIGGDVFQLKKLLFIRSGVACGERYFCRTISRGIAYALSCQVLMEI